MITILAYIVTGGFIIGVILLLLIASYVRGILVHLRKANRVTAMDFETCDLNGKVTPKCRTADGKWHDMPVSAEGPWPELKGLGKRL